MTRDQGRTERAIAAPRRGGAQNLSSEYALTAKRKIEIGRDQLAAKEMAIGRANQEKKNFIGAINRFFMVVTQYQTGRGMSRRSAGAA